MANWKQELQQEIAGIDDLNRITSPIESVEIIHPDGMRERLLTVQD